MSEKEVKRVSPLKAIRLKCLECCAGRSNEVKACHLQDCPLWAYRFGRNLDRPKRVLTEEQRQELRERLAKARKKQAGQGLQNAPSGL
jgi:hypothetical protein